MYLIKRTSTVPNSPLQVQVDGPDGAFQQGGVYYFQPAGQDNDQHQVSEHAARIIMGDPGLAQHFECDPALPDAVPEPAAEAEPGSTTAADSGGRGRRSR